MTTSRSHITRPKKAVGTVAFGLETFPLIFPPVLCSAKAKVSTRDADGEAYSDDKKAASKALRKKGVLPCFRTSNFLIVPLSQGCASFHPSYLYA
jgi:hypothetical protein